MIRVVDLPKSDILYRFSNPKTAQKKSFRYLGKNTNAILYKSVHKKKKYSIINPLGKTIHFGQIGYADFTKHRDLHRRKNYLTRTKKIKGNWKSNPYSPNQLSRNILW